MKIILFKLTLFSRSLPKLSSNENEEEALDKKKVVNYFEPIPHDHNLCERVVINVSIIHFVPHDFIRLEFIRS